MAKSQRIAFDLVAAWARDFGCFTRKQDQLWYENSDTAVYFCFDFDPKGPEDPEESAIPSGYTDTGLSFNLNFNRPSFFGYETMPVVEELARHFSVCVVNPQAWDAESALQREVDATKLLESWLDHNRRAILTLIKDPDFSIALHMPLSKSLYRWKYMKAKKGLESACGEDIFVPALSVVRRQGSNQLGAAFVCTLGVPSIVPDADWVFVVRPKKGFLGSRKDPEVGAISITTFRELVATNLDSFRWDEPAVHVISPESTERVAKILQSCDLKLHRSEFEGVAPDSFVDIDLPAETRVH